jgi:ribonuclease HI
MKGGRIGKVALQTFTGQIQPYFRIGGHATYKPPFIAQLQTDGSRRSHDSRIAAILTSSDEMTTYKRMVAIAQTESSTEVEWAAIVGGIEFALQKGETCIGVENDNLGVVGALITGQREFRHSYAYYYRDKIDRLTRLTLWTGIRWIPREMNRADDLFR